MTTFQQRVYAATLLIPEGRVTTYKTLAETLKVNSAQAIGQALKKNPDAPTVPCHRVIRADGYIGGYMGKYDEKKKLLLAKEGVAFSDEGYLIDPEKWLKKL